MSEIPIGGGKTIDPIQRPIIDPVDTETKEAVCPTCGKGPIQLISGYSSVSNSDGLRLAFGDEWSRCASCGEEFYTKKQSLASTEAGRKVKLDDAHGASVDLETTRTNIVMVRFAEPQAREVAQRLAERGVLAIPLSPEMLRFVTHREVEDDDVDRALAAMSEILS